MRRRGSGWYVVLVLAAVGFGVLGPWVSYGAEAGRFYSLIYDCSRTRGTGIVVANASNRDTSYTLEVYDSLGNLLLTETQSLAPFDSYWHGLGATIDEELEDVDWDLAWGLCIVRPLVYATDLLIVSVEVFEGENLVSVFQIEASHY